MATSILTRTFDSESDQDINVLATNKYCAPLSRTVDLSFLQPDVGGTKSIKAGSIFCNIPNSNFVRVLPLTTVAAALTSSDTTITVADAKIFRNGGALTIARPYATLTFGGTVAPGNTVTNTLQGQALPYTLLAGDTTATIAAASFAAFINAGSASDKVRAIASGLVVHFFSKTGIPYTFATSVTGGGITSVASATIMQENVVIAAIHASTPINTATNLITLAAGSAVTLPIGSPIGIVTKPSDILGLSVEKRLVASTQALQMSLSNDVNIYTEADIYTSLIPFWDSVIASALPQITSVARG
jgi:hypothetical protein